MIEIIILTIIAIITIIRYYYFKYLFKYKYTQLNLLNIILGINSFRKGWCW